MKFDRAKVRLNRRAKKKAESTWMFVQATVPSREAPPAVWLREKSRAIAADCELGNESEPKLIAIGTRTSAFFLFPIKLYMRTANNFHVSWLL